MKIPAGVVHRLPLDLRHALESEAKARATWMDITPLARNEWICWITHTRKPETRKAHLERALDELRAGKRRPCCWPGCPHRNPRTKKWFQNHKKGA